MARKRRQPDGDRPGRRRPARPPFARPRQSESAPEAPLDRAHELLLFAYQEEDEERQNQLATKALEICPDCADAFTLLAVNASTRKQALRLYEQGVAAGERSLGQEAFQRYAGSFWEVLETRPYMRARLGLAHVLWTTGRRDESVRHLQDMLRLNPHNDEQGVRRTLAGFLLFLDRDDELDHLLGQYPDDHSAAWAYTRALLAFRRQGDTQEARRLLKKAKKTNKYVPAYLTGRKFPPDKHPRRFRPGDKSEALHYIDGFLAGWKDTAGAVAWLRARKKRKAPEPQGKGPLGFIKKWARDRLPQEYDVWQADFRQSPHWLRIGGEPARPWMILVTSQSTGLVLAHQVLDEEPSSVLLWDRLLQAMQHPAAGNPHRPTELQVRPSERWEALKPHVEEVGVDWTVAEELDQVERVFELIGEDMGGKPQPGLLDMPGVRPDQVARFYEAAAAFFEQAPWKKVGYESAVKVECDRFHSGPWYAVLMGQSGLTSGLALYDDLETLRKVWEGGTDDERARQTVGTSVTFEEEWDVPPADLDAARRYGWKVARPDAYPEVFHKERGFSGRPPLAWELELLEGCLRALPGFLDRRKQDDPAREEVTTAGSLKLVLSWVVEDEAE